MEQVKEERDKWNQLRVDFYNIPCEHKNIKEGTIADDAIGVERYEYCTDCNEEL